MENIPERCLWARSAEAIDYHDAEWGVPQYDDRMLFEMLILEGAQAGLSWDTILKRRLSYRECFANFDPALVAEFDDEKTQELLANPGIIRNRAKVASAVKNAQAFLAVQREYGSFAKYIWGFVDGTQIVTRRAATDALPAKNSLSDLVSKNLKKRGFSFVGSTIMYSYLQAIGIIDDHSEICFRAKQQPRSCSGS
jgi:DNA-3-methyladenine glycosylase I